MKYKSIVIISDYLLKDLVGGAQFVDSLIYSRLVQEGHRVSHLVVNQSSTDFEIIDSLNADALFICSISQFTLNQLYWLISTKIPYIIFRHDIPTILYSSENTHISQIFSTILKCSRGVIYISELQKTFHERKNRDHNSIIIPPPALLRNFFDKKQHRSGAVYLGPINTLRGVIEASDYVRNYLPGEQLTFIGRIESPETHYELLRRGHLFRHEVSRDDVPYILNTFDHFIYFPRMVDSFCLKILEAELCGIKIHTNRTLIGRYCYPETADELKQRMEKSSLDEIVGFFYKSLAW